VNQPIARIAIVVIALAGAGAAPCAAQNRFQHLIPGTSTVEDAIRVLGRPVRNTAAGEMEFAPPAGTSRVIIGAQAGVIDRIEVSLQPPIVRSSLLKYFGLPTDADARAMTKGRLVEYFGGDNLLAFDYASEDPAPGVTSVEYLSPGRFAIASGLVQRSPAEPPGRVDNLGPPPPRVSSPNIPPPPRNETAAGVENNTAPGTSQDDRQALQSYEKAAAAGDPAAMFKLAYMYATADGVAQDFGRAREWYQKAAAAGLGSAMTNLGILYSQGYGVPQDYQQARQWFEKAAARGDATAMYNLGALYENARDYNRAREWYQKAAAGGDADATQALERLR
jgi:hypothetical protein